MVMFPAQSIAVGKKVNWLFTFASLAFMLFVAGCGKGEVTESGDEENESPTVSIPSQEAGDESPLARIEIDEGEAEDDELDEIVAPPEGTPEWTLREITKLPLPQSEDVEELRKLRRERNEKIIEMATTVIRKTHDDKKKDRLFNAAVHHLLEARLQIALTGDQEAIDALYDDAESLWERDKDSKAAADSSFTLVNLCYSMAKMHAAKEPGWLKEFARQASHFAINFPSEDRRSLPMLFTAGRSCELFLKTDDAKKIYALIQKKFPETSQAEASRAITRRLMLPGSQADIQGPLFDGGEFQVSQLKGSVVLVVFWHSQAADSSANVPVIKELQKAYKDSFKVVGVCLDKNEADVESFINGHQLDWTQIFFAEDTKIGWNNPIASYYGVMEVGMWLLDRNGVVVSTSITAKDLDASISPLLKRGASRN